ncbi:MAG: homoserine O-acetyltransferase [Candidatus Omnitrophica bacterium]|nr:homoserine O-acetyltransferase [Candidatus Omnitrophota bacterium]MBU1995660.1 homoserine O-acetyltransferase [Candidatus Omnitrophota bacterium]
MRSFNENSVGFVETQFYSCCEPPNELILSSGEKLESITIAYETYGTLSEDKNNAILIFHALTGDAHAAGFHKGDKKPGWWDNMIGPNKAFNTEKYFIICSNVIGSCQGSTGPSSIDAKTGKPYGLSFPIVTINDMVIAQKHLIDHLGISKLMSIAGGSMGGMQALSWSVLFPESIASAIIIATNTIHTPQQIAFHEVARQAIKADPDWQNGDYYGKSIPARGLAVARMMGHITYMSDKSMQEKFGRRLQDKEKLGYDFSSDFEIENYLKHRGDSFVQRFDANSWLYLSKALDYFDLSEGKKLSDVFSKSLLKFLVVSFTSDWLYPPYQTKQIVKALKVNEIDVSNIEIDASYGHDSFLVETEDQSRLIEHFLKRVAKEQ